jgi:hypothetical protein
MLSSPGVRPIVTRHALVTLAIGERHAGLFEQHARAGWTAYAERHGLDLIAFKQPLDTSARARARSPAWQKCLILGAPGMDRYDQVAWVDSDIAINPASPSVFAGVPPEALGATDEHAFPAPALRQDLLQGIIACSPDTGDFGKPYWEAWREAGAWHAAAGLPPGQAHIVQTGVMVLSPRHHRALLEQAYYGHEDCGLNYEMRALSFEIQKRGPPHWLEPRFNALVWWLYLAATMQTRIETPEEIAGFVREMHRRSHFLHFAGAANLMPLLGS